VTSSIYYQSIVGPRLPQAMYILIYTYFRQRITFSYTYKYI